MKMQCFRIIMLCSAATIGLIGISAPVAGQDAESSSISNRDRQRFESDVRPILVKHCYECHSQESGRAEGGLLLDTREASRRGGDSGPAVVPGNVSRSLLVLAIRYQNADLAMPPSDAGGKLSNREIRILEEWVRNGAPDPRDGEPIEREHYNYDQARQWWAFQPVQKMSVPSDENDSWSWVDLDRFIQAKRQAAELTPVADASPEAILRRVCFDLIGLPPSVDELQQFWSRLDQREPLRDILADHVDRLLQSQQFGMHWGRHWLDVARFAESSGRDVNATYPHAWRYRDYVIDAFNKGVPYDQFLREQIAGDLLPYQNDYERTRQLIATGFLAVGSRSLNEMNPRQFAVDQADEQIDSVFQATMALTVGCARCHDHKFDPIPQTDYTAIAGIFLSTETYYGATGGGIGRNRAEGIALSTNISQTVARKNLNPNAVAEMKEELTALRAQLEEFQKQRQQQRRQPDNPAQVQMVLQNRARINLLEAELTNYDENGNVLPYAMGVLDKSNQAPSRFVLARNRGANALTGIMDSPLFVRGDIAAPSDRIPRGVLTLFDNADSVQIPRQSSGRLELANWVTSPDNPMTARVAVNRIWYWLFGKGLVASLDNFGTSGSEPTHPELLDFLANQFIESGWNTKALIRDIVMSHTYQLATQHNEAMFLKDPDNSSYWRYPDRRLTAECIRDAMLAASGKLDDSPQIGSYVGRSMAGVVGQGRVGIREDLVVRDSSQARSIFLPVPRGVSNELLSTFDFPDAAAVQTARETTNVPTQSLYLLNSLFVSEQASGLANRILRSYPGKTFDRFDDRIELAYQAVHSRNPSELEKGLARKLLSAQPGIPKSAWTSLCRGLFGATEFRYLD